MSKPVASVRRISKGIQRRENRMPKYAALIYSPAETEGTMKVVIAARRG